MRRRKRAEQPAAAEHPKAFVRNLLDRHGLNVTTGAQVLGVHRVSLSRLVSGAADMSPEMALRFELAFPGISMHVLMLMQTYWDEQVVRARGIQVPGLAAAR